MLLLGRSEAKIVGEVSFLVNHQTFPAEAKSNFEVFLLPSLLLPICCLSRVIAIENRLISAIKGKNAL